MSNFPESTFWGVCKLSLSSECLSRDADSNRYSNVLLSVLNSRKRARHQLVEPNQTFSLNFAQQSTTAPVSSIFEEVPSNEVASKTQKDEESHVKSESSA